MKVNPKFPNFDAEWGREDKDFLEASASGESPRWRKHVSVSVRGVNLPLALPLNSVAAGSVAAGSVAAYSVGAWVRGCVGAWVRIAWWRDLAVWMGIRRWWPAALPVGSDGSEGTGRCHNGI